MGFIGSHRPTEKRGAKAEPDFLPPYQFLLCQSSTYKNAQEKRPVT